MELNENTYLDASNEFVKELEKSKILAKNIDVVVGPSQWGKPGELRFRDHVTLRAAGIETELYVIPRGSFTDFELYTDTGYESGREIKVGDAKTIIKAMKRYVNKMNESLDEGMSKSAIKKAIKVIDRQIDTETGGDGEPLDNETLQALEQERERLLAMNESVNEQKIKLKVWTDRKSKKKTIDLDASQLKKAVNSGHDTDWSWSIDDIKYQLDNGDKKGTTKIDRYGGGGSDTVYWELNESVNEGRDDVVFVIDDGNLDNKFLMTRSLSRNLDYQHDSGDQYYVLPKRDFDRLEDYADSHGYDTDSIYVIEESVNEAATDRFLQSAARNLAKQMRGKSASRTTLMNRLNSMPLANRLKPDELDKIVDYAMQEMGLNESLYEAKMPDKYIGNDEIVYLKTKEDSRGAHYNLYYKGHDIDVGGRNFRNEMDLIDFADDYILSNQLYNKLKHAKSKPLPESVTEGRLDHKVHAIEDSILQGVASWIGTTKGKLFNIIRYDRKAARDLADLSKHLKPILDNWDEYGKVEEKLTQTFGDYLKDLDARLEDGHKAAMGDNGGEQLENRQTALHNLRLFGNYIKSLLKEYGKDKTKLTFMKESRNVMTLESFLNEELPTQEIDPNKFQNPYKSDKNFFKKGYKDDSVMDDVVKTKPVKIQASQLKPSQDAVYLGKALGMAIGGVEGGNLEAVISQDNRILDGHHRWAATIFNNPKARVGGVQAELKIGDLVPVLRQAGDALGNKRGLPPKGGDQNIFKATLDDVKDAIYDGKYMNPQFYNKDKAIAWFEEQGEKKIQSALNLLQRVGPPGGAPPRADMPKIEPEQVQQVAKKLQGGAIDVRAPYVKEELNHLTSLESFIDEKKPGPDPYMTNLSKDDEEDKEEQMKKQAAMDDDDPNAYKDMPGDKEAREKGDMKKSKHTSAYHKKFKKVKSLEEFANDWAVIKEGYNADAVAQNVVVALDSAAQFFPRYKPAEAEAEVKDVLKKYRKLQGKSVEKAAKDIRNSLEDRGLLSNDILPIDVEIIIMDNLNESNIHENLNKSDVAYQLAMDYSGNSKPKIVKLNKKEIHVKYGYKIPHEESIKSILKIHPDIELTHVGWSNTPSGGGIHKFKINESVVNEAKDNLYLQLHKKYAEQIKGLKAKKIKKLTDLVSVQRWSMEDREDYFDMARNKKKELSAEYDEERRLFKKYMAKDYSVMLPKGTESLRESVITEEKDQTNDKSKIDGEGIETGLKKKADETGVPIGILRVIMRRGMAAWKSGHRPGTNSTQWGYARVNSFLTKGDGTWGKADKDMAKEVRDGGHDKKL